MYAVCPKCGHDRGADRETGADTCPSCGIIYSKWLKQQLRPPTAVAAGAEPARESLPAGIAALLFSVEEKVNPFVFWGRAVVFAGLVILGWHFLRLDFAADPTAIGNSFMHSINLVFHEAGHVLFKPFGWFMMILGGTLGQLLVPAVLAMLFLVKYHNPFAAAVCLWWLGQSFLDCAPYIDDALHQELLLLGGHTGADAPGNHDWNNILGELNMLERHRELATLADSTGTLLIIAALIWGGYLLYRQYGNLERF
jgi:hypothetical protein